MPGPTPKPAEQRRRRNAPLANTIKLPAGGRTGTPPAWPMVGRAPKIWADLWATPQAAAWEQLGWTRVVARYTRVLRLCEDPETMTAALLGEARQMEDRLGLSPLAMLRLRWEISADELEAKREPEKPKARRTLRIASAVEA